MCTSTDGGREGRKDGGREGGRGGRRGREGGKKGGREGRKKGGKEGGMKTSGQTLFSIPYIVYSVYLWIVHVHVVQSIYMYM